MIINNSVENIPRYNEVFQENKYILITSLNLGGAEKIVADQLWANYYSKSPDRITLIIIYDKEKEHSIPPNVNLIRLKNKIENGETLFKQIAFESANLVCHLINDNVLNYLFSLGVKLTLVMHNDKAGWLNSNDIFSHPNIIKLVAVCNYVKNQLKEITDKPIITVRHQIDYSLIKFNQEKRDKIREELNIKSTDIVLGMVGRIARQKNYILAIKILHELIKTNKNYKLVILGGFEKSQMGYYLEIISTINKLKVHNNVFLLGFKTNVKDYINIFDIGLNTSHFEGLSMATQELIGNGLHIVLTDVCGQKEILDLNNQLHFVSATESEDQIKNDFIEKIKNIKERFIFIEESLTDNKKIKYSSHNLWRLLNVVFDRNSVDKKNVAFLTSNLNLGGAQKSLTNLLIELNKQQYDIPLIIANQGYTDMFLSELVRNNIDYWLAHQSRDVFDIVSNIMTYIKKKNIGKIIFWNVDSKIKLLLTKLTDTEIDFIDVSPGDYCLVEMEQQKSFQNGIYYYDIDYFNTLKNFVSKFDNTKKDYNYKKLIESKTKIIRNGVNFSLYKENNSKQLNKILVCGRVVPSKYIDLIINAYKLLNDSKIKLYFIGSTDNYFKDYANKIIEDNNDLINKDIFFLGNHNNPQEIMHDYDLLIVLGKHQGCPNTVLEGASIGIPIIANHSGGTAEILKFSDLIKDLNVDSLYNKLVDAKQNYLAYKSEAELNKEYVRDFFSMPKMASNYIDFLKLNKK